MIGSFVMSIFARGGVSLKRIKEVLGTQPDVVFKDEAPAEELDGDVEFDNVTFAYPDADKPILKNISFKVKSGEMVGIVGATGSGKSSLAQLLPRLYDPTEGTVRIGGHDLRDVNEKSLRDTVSYVYKEQFYFQVQLPAIYVKEKQMQLNMNWNVHRKLHRHKNSLVGIKILLITR